MSKYDDPKKEFERGYNFGKEDGVNEVIKMIVENGAVFAEQFETDSILIKIPKEYFTALRVKASSTA